MPLRPERVLEVKYEHMEGTRFRHLAHFIRWRDDRTPESCTYEQLEQPVSFQLADIVPGLGGRRPTPSTPDPRSQPISRVHRIQRQSTNGGER